jgi:integrase
VRKGVPQDLRMDDPELTFHNFRHAWKRRTRASAVKEEVHDVLSGHASVTVSRKYGDGLDIHDLAKAMAQIDFPMFPAVACGDNR